MRKEFTYRGKTLSELGSMSIKEFATIVPSRQRRSLSKGMSELHKKVLEKLRSNDQNVRTHAKDMVVLPEMVGKIIRVHNGKQFETLTIMAEMIGHYLGEFVPTRKKVAHHAPGIGATKSSAALSVK